MPTDWLRVVLEEVAQKRAAAERARREVELRREAESKGGPATPPPAVAPRR